MRTLWQPHPAPWRLLVAPLVLAAACAAGVSPAHAGPDLSPAALAGTYQLRGVHEVGSLLRLDRTGRFEYSLSYGAVDTSATGVWRVDGNKVVLAGDPAPPPSLSVGERRDRFLDSYTQPGEPPVLLTVKVATPALGLVWSEMEITAEFSNGRRRTGVTGPSGAIGFKRLDDAQWKGAVVRRVSVAYPAGKVAPVWAEVDAARDKTIVFHFQPGALMPPAFTSMRLLPVRSHGAVRALKVLSQDGSVQPGEYVRADSGS
jgi:hypothetical protein